MDRKTDSSNQAQELSKEKNWPDPLMFMFWELEYLNLKVLN